jgi:hypothetical protein
MRHDAFEGGQRDALVGFRGTDDVRLCQLMAEKVCQVGIRVGTSQRVGAHRIHQHSERCDPEPPGLVAQERPQHRRGQVGAAADRLRKDDVGVRAVERLSRADQIGQPAAEAPAAHLSDRHTGRPRQFRVDQPTSLIVRDHGRTEPARGHAPRRLQNE